MARSVRTSTSLCTIVPITTPVPVTTAPETRPAETRRLTLWRAGLRTVFFSTGIAIATWVTRTPAIRDGLDASTAEMGLVIAGLSIGSLVGISLGAPLVARLGARAVVVGGMVAMVAGLAVMALGTALGQGLVVAAGLAVLGYGIGSGEIGNNVSGVELEAAMGRSVVPGLHGCFSLGTVVGALAGLGANHVALPVPVHLLVAAALIAGAAAWLGRHIPVATGRTAPRPQDAPEPGAVGPDARETGPAEPRFAYLDRRLLGLGVIILGMALAEGSASDWLPLIVVDGFGSTASLGSVVYAFFGAAMAVGRLGGGRVIDRFGRVAVMRTSAFVGAAGIATVVLAPNLGLAAVGVLLWGIGASLGFPVALSAAGDDPRHAARRASLVATAGYAAFLVGPPVLGFLGEHVGLRDAMVVVLVMVLATSLFARSVRPQPAPSGEPSREGI